MATDEKENQAATAAAAAQQEEEISSELSEPRWSVISFEKCEASGLTYDEAARELKELEEKKVSGLCIVPDEVGARLS